MLRARLELWRLRPFLKGQDPELYAAVGFVRDPEALVGKILRVGQKALLFCGGQDGQSFTPLLFRVPYALAQQLA